MMKMEKAESFITKAYPDGRKWKYSAIDDSIRLEGKFTMGELGQVIIDVKDLKERLKRLERPEGNNNQD